MKIFILIILLLLVLACMFLSSSVLLKITYVKNEAENEGELWIKYLFFKKRIFPKAKDKKKSKDKEQTGKKHDLEYIKTTSQRFLKIFEAIKSDLGEILRYCTEKLIVADKLSLDVRFGLSDPMQTGIASGVVYGAVYNVLGFIYNRLEVKSNDINIVPDFEKECQNVNFCCILKLKNVHITVIIVKLVKVLNKCRKIIKEEKGSN